MRILLLCHSFNSLTQRFHVELRQAGHEVSVEFDINDAVTKGAVELFRPELVVAPFLKRAIPAEVWRAVPCWVVHPGVRGDRGPSALDWAVLEGAERWGVTLIEAREEMDAGPVLAWREFPMRSGTKSSLYRTEVTEAAVACLFEALERFGAGATLPAISGTVGRTRPLCPKSARMVDFAADDGATILRRIRSADGMPGAAGRLFGEEIRLFDAHPAEGLSGQAGEVLARSGPALAVATTDGALWIGHVKREGEGELKLPATRLFAAHTTELPERAGYPCIRYEEEGGVGYLHFAFYNGAMSVADCRDLRAALAEAAARPTRLLVLMGGPDFWSNGLNLALIEAAESPAEESWDNINAMNDLVRDIVRMEQRLVVSAIRGNAGAGGVFLALAADAIWMRQGAILSPHYKDMGNLYGSEYWTYLLPRRIGEEGARRIAETRWPMGHAEAARLGVVDALLPADLDACEAAIRAAAVALAAAPDLSARIAARAAARAADEARKPLEAYRAAELERMRRNFWGFDPSYHVARHNFIRKVRKSRTPLTLALHRSTGARTAPFRPRPTEAAQ